MTLAIVQLLLLATALLTAERNRSANRLLAGLLVVIAGLLTPYGIGFAGFYDMWPWLSFAPFSNPLALGPLIWGYSHTLTTGRTPRHFLWHLAPAITHFAYQAICFALPFETKMAVAEHFHDFWIDPLISAGTLFGLAAYAVMAGLGIQRYRRALAEERSDTARYAANWLTRAIAAILVALVVWVAYQAAELAIGRLNYFQVFGLYLVLGAVGLFIGIEGWRHAGLAFPPFPAPLSVPAPQTGGRDWAALGSKWSRATETAGWWRDDALTLAGLAAKLGTNTAHLSRALNEGLGVNFATFVNAIRADAVAAQLRTEAETGETGDLLDLAFACGFASKASFNRAFRARFSVSPSEYRRLHGSKHKNPAENEVMRRAAE